MSEPTVRVCVIGAGISALSSAFCIAEQYSTADITIISEDFSPNLTSNHGFGIISLRAVDPVFDCVNTLQWSFDTYEHCKYLYQHHPQKSEEMGINKVDGMIIIDKTKKEQDEKHFMMYDSPLLQLTADNVSQATSQQLRNKGFADRLDGMKSVFGRYDVTAEQIDAYNFQTFVLDNHAYLPYLLKEMETMAMNGRIRGFRIQKRRILSLSDVFNEDFDVVVNACGLSASYVIKDRNVVPIRGQYILMDLKRPIDLHYAGNTFICPKAGRVALGSVYQVGRSDIKVDPRDTEDILDRTSAICPVVKNGKIIKVDVGIRPARYGGPRVELEWAQYRPLRKEVPVIHNYGHGAKGILQHWGCAKEVSRLFGNALYIKARL